MLLIESEHDPIVPQAVLSSYREACVHAHSLTYRCIAGADHGLSADTHQRAYTKLLVAWMSEMMVGARQAPARPSASADTAALPERPPRALAVDR